MSTSNQKHSWASPYLSRMLSLLKTIISKRAYSSPTATTNEPKTNWTNELSSLYVFFGSSSRSCRITVINLCEMKDIINQVTSGLVTIIGIGVSLTVCVICCTI